MRLFWEYATRRECVYRAVKVALLVGTILALINHSDLLFHKDLNPARIFRILLTYFVPYAVSTYSSAMQALASERRNLTKN